jgi:hypothetical protein
LEVIYRDLYSGGLDKASKLEEEHRQAITEALASLA